MREVSNAWRRTVTGSFTPVFRATLCSYFQTGTSPVGERLDILDGSVSLDGSADIYSSLKLTVPGEMWPESHVDDRLAPYGPEVYIQAGVMYRDDLVELVGLGYHRIKTLSQDDAETGDPIELTGQDRNAGLARAKLLAPRQYTADITNGEFATDLVTEVYPEAVIEWDDNVENLPLGRDIIVESDRLGPLISMAQSVGKIMRWDHRGVLTFRAVPQLLGGDPVVRLASGRDGVLVRAARELTDEEVTNAIVARGDGADAVAAAYAVAYDLDPTSPTRYNGPFGPSPKFITSSFITSNADATIAARAELSRRAGLLHTIRFEISPRFEIEPDDLAFIQTRTSMGRHFIAALDIPLVAGGTMTGSTRAESLTIVGAP